MPVPDFGASGEAGRRQLRKSVQQAWGSQHRGKAEENGPI
jgi:hypothetical protein